jgi:hypothetical protein
MWLLARQYEPSDSTSDVMLAKQILISAKMFEQSPVLNSNLRIALQVALLGAGPLLRLIRRMW